jgi:predicted negative regulator of RcsB-dependent stress response
MDNDRDILLIAMLTFLTVFAWIFFDLVQTSKTSTITASTATLLKPISSKIDQETINALGTRVIFR